MNVDEWIRQLQWIPPYPKVLIRIVGFTDISKGRLVKIEIVDKPKDLTQLMQWAEYRKSIGKPLIIARTYLMQAKVHAIMVKMHDDDYPVFISIPELDVYVKRTAFNKSHRIRTTLRYVLYYSGYKLKYKYLNVPANRYIVTKQTTLNV